MGESAAILQVQRLGGSRRRTIELGAMPLTIGRSSENVLPLRHADVSRRHCVVEPGPEGFRLRDLGSRFGTQVNGVPVESCVLGDRDRVRVGPYELVVVLNGRATTDASAPPATDRWGGVAPEAMALLDEADSAAEPDPPPPGVVSDAVAAATGESGASEPSDMANLKEALDQALKRIRTLEKQQVALHRNIRSAAPLRNGEGGRGDMQASVAAGAKRPSSTEATTGRIANPLIAAVAGSENRASNEVPPAQGLRDRRLWHRGDAWADRDYLAWVVVGVCGVALVSVIVLALIQIMG